MTLSCLGITISIGPSVLSLYLRPWKFWALWVNGRLEIGKLDAVICRCEGRFDRRTKLWKQMAKERQDRRWYLTT